MQELDINQWIGFFITLFAVVFLTIKRLREEKYRQNHPEEAEREASQGHGALREYLKSINADFDKAEEEEKEEVIEHEFVEKKLPHPIPKVLPPLSGMNLGEKPSEIATLIRKLPSNKQIVLLHEVMGPPKGLQ